MNQAHGSSSQAAQFRLGRGSFGERELPCKSQDLRLTHFVDDVQDLCNHLNAF